MSPDLLITRQLISDSWLVTGVHLMYRNPEGWRVKLSATRSKVPHHTRGRGHLLVSMGATSRYPHRVLFAPITHNAYGMELSVTQSKISHHTHGGGYLLVSAGATSRYPLPRPWFFLPSLSSTWHATIIILGTWDIWSLPLSSIGTYISYPNEFYWSTHPSTNY